MLNRMSIFEFIKHTKENPLKFINYCEVLLTRFGDVIICNPSHTETAIEYVMNKCDKSREEIMDEIPALCLPLEWLVDKYGLVAVWNCGYLYSSSSFNKFQKRSIKLLIKNNLLKEYDELFIKPATEYKLYLKRKEMGVEYEKREN
jgi:hypothetical protein